ncbi:MAG: phosphate ABC transporter substrate-binding protein [Chloroflexi bacterium]|nr:phosphate ABC transporter substrate-binding protein [Chloroflexota bacterium]
MRQIIGSIVLVMALALAACAPAAAPAPQTAAEATQPAASQAVTETTTNTDTQAMTATTATTSETTTGADLSGKLTIAGSSALLPMMQAAAAQFQSTNPNLQITVTGGGSGAGRSQVCGGQIDIGDSDVKLSDKEKTDFKCDDAVETPVAIQAFAPVANKEGPGATTNLTKQQLVDIFSGKTTNWKDVGGDDQEIVLINRAKGSGTRSNMAKFLFGGDDAQFATGASEEDNNETVLQTVSQTPGAISYLGFAYLSNEGIFAFSIDGVAPTKEDIQSGTWPIGGPGYAITKGEPTPLAKAFLDFVTSAEWQNSDAFSKLGFVPVAK